MKTIKYIPYDVLVGLNKKAIKRGYNRAIDPKWLYENMPVVNYVVTFEMLHNDCEMRVVFAWMEGDKTKTGTIDMDLKDWDYLPVYEEAA